MRDPIAGSQGDMQRAQPLLGPAAGGQGDLQGCRTLPLSYIVMNLSWWLRDK